MESINSAKATGMDTVRVRHDGGSLTTNQGVGIPDPDNSLKAGERGPTLLEDFIYREKVTHFDHERIPERIVHARGSGAHGYFRVYKSLSDVTKAHFLSDPELVTPVFVRFSTVAGFRGSADTVRDVRGFAVKFYTQEGNYDLVGNNMPVFFIQDAVKFPDLIHALKPEPDNGIPQAQSAHDTFWDFVVHTPETLHNILWLMSDRALPQSYRMMQGFGIHTFLFVNAKGEYKFVKFHWKPLLGVHSLVWDECQKIAGKDPDFNRRDLWNSIENGDYPEFELGVQLLDPKDEFKFDFDILDCTKLWPEEMVPVQPIGKMVLNQNVTNFFAETEQVAFCPANLVPGIDLSNDPMLQGRLFSYLDTQLSRLGGPNFQQIPINRPLVPVNNNQRDGFHRVSIDEGKTAYSPNGINANQPHPATASESRFEHLPIRTDGHVIRNRSASFNDHFTQPAMFWNSLCPYEQTHVVDAFRFELGKCSDRRIRQKLVDLLGNINADLATRVADGLGMIPPVGAKGCPNASASPALSMANTVKSARTRRVAVLIGTGFDREQFSAVTNAIVAAGAHFDTVSCKLGSVGASDGTAVECTKTFDTTASVLYDAVYVPGGDHLDALKADGKAFHFVSEAYAHFKTVGLEANAAQLLRVSRLGAAAVENPDLPALTGVVLSREKETPKAYSDRLIAALSMVRHFERDTAVLTVPA